jgi:choline-glycine betaine transporter
MNDKRNYGMYAIAVAIVVVGALMVGALESLVWLALVAACPLMMIFMMRGMHGQGSMYGGHDDQRRADRNEDPLHKHDHHPGPGRS